MKAITIRPLERMNPEFSQADAVAAKVAKRPYRVKQIVPIPVGEVIDNPEAWRLVENGSALPADDECRDVIVMVDEELVEIIAKQEILCQARGTGNPEHDGPRRDSQVQLPKEWEHLRAAVDASILKKQDEIDRQHNNARQSAEEEKAESRAVYVIDASDLPPEEDDLPPEDNDE